MTEPETGTSDTRMQIAVIGMAARFPGARDIKEFWDNLKNGRETITFFSNEEWEAAGVDPGLLKKSNPVKARGVLEDMECFDACFFGYTPGEAEIMDPQVRIFLECAWQALEDAGYVAPGPQGTIGCYAAGQLDGGDFLRIHVARCLNLEGQAVEVPAVCSTSLAALHLGCCALSSGECDMALAGGVSLPVGKKEGYPYQQDMTVSPDRPNRVFDARADGTIPGDGVGVVVLKPLEKAVADRDHIYAIIKGSAVTHDGIKKPGYTAPGSESQAAVIRMACQAAAISPETVSYIETHGTGASFEDPVEIKALELAFHTHKKKFCRIGSVKTNIGDLNAAAGIAGLIKTILALAHRLIPPSLHFAGLNPGIDFENSPFYVNTELAGWERCDGIPLRAGVSSFSAGTANVHVLLEEAPPIESAAGSKHWKLLLLSAKTPPSLEQVSKNLLKFLKENRGINLADAAYTLQVGRSAFPYRRFVLCPDIDGAIEALSAPQPEKTVISHTKEEKQSIIFMFPGLGAQYVGMTRDLYRAVPVFREEMERCFTILGTLVDFDVKEILYPGLETGNQAEQEENSYRIHQVEIAQIALFIIQYTLAKMLMKWGIKPHAMIGYSFGEYTAACLSGVFSLENALKIITARGKLIAGLPAGTMLSVPLPLSEVTPLLTDELSIAIDNGPSCIVAGPVEAVTDFQERIKAKRLMCMPLVTSCAIHSKMMNPIAGEFEKILGTVELSKPQIPYISGVTGGWVGDRDAVSPGYWVKHLTETVRFADGIERLLKEPGAIFIEVGPGRDLTTLLQRRKKDWSENRHHVINLVKPQQQNLPDDFHLMNRIGRLWLYGGELDWPGFHAGNKRRRVSLPPYPFARQPFRIPVNFFKSGLESGENKSAPRKKTDIADWHKPGTLTEAQKTGEEKNDKNKSPRWHPHLTAPYVAPQTDIEQTMANIWQNMFAIEKVGIHDDFFELGGDSLKALQLVSELQKKFAVNLNPGDIFNSPRIIDLTALINSAYSPGCESIEPIPLQDYYDLSPAQKHLWHTDRIISHSTNASYILHLDMPLHINILEKSLQLLIERHESLRTNIVRVNGVPRQLIHRKINFKPEIYDYSNSGDIIEKIAEHHSKLSKYPFDLAEDILFKLAVVKEHDEKWHIIFVIHHIISDGGSWQIFKKELLDLYEALEQNKENPLPPLRIQVKDYAAYLNKQLCDEELTGHKIYWHKRLSGKLPVIELPKKGDHAHLLKKSSGSTHRWKMSQTDFDNVIKLKLQTKSTIFVIFFAAFNILLNRVCHARDILIKIPISLRTHDDLTDVIGFLINHLLIRTQINENDSFLNFLRDVKANIADAFKYYIYPIGQLISELNLQFDINKKFIVTPLSFNMINNRNNNIDVVGFEKTHTEPGKVLARQDLRLFVDEYRNGLVVGCDYRDELFNAGTIEKMMKEYEQILSVVSVAPGTRIKDILKQ
jgi:acyl transferase domain-containing protein/NRPS condensation-like uncharacterized protein